MWLGSHEVLGRLEVITEAWHALGPGIGLWFLGSEWTYLEVTWPCNTLLESIPKRDLPRVRRCFMDPQERRTFKSLPETIRCYRGGGRADVLRGVSWSLSRTIAERFAQYAGGARRAWFGMAIRNPVVVTANVEKSQVFAVKLDRAEEEIIILPGQAHVESIDGEGGPR